MFDGIKLNQIHQIVWITILILHEGKCSFNDNDNCLLLFILYMYLQRFI